MFLDFDTRAILMASLVLCLTKAYIDHLMDSELFMSAVDVYTVFCLVSLCVCLLEDEIRLFLLGPSCDRYRL